MENNRISNPPRSKFRHHKWDNFEDLILISLVAKQKCQENQINWVDISRQMHNRSVRQCKERWGKYLSPSVNNGPWSKEEDELLLKKYHEMGSQWTLIATFFNGRSDTNVKNRWLQIEREWKKKNIQHKKENNDLPSILVLGGSIHKPSLPINYQKQDIKDSNSFSNSFNNIINEKKSCVTQLMV